MPPSLAIRLQKFFLIIIKDVLIVFIIILVLILLIYLLIIIKHTLQQRYLARKTSLLENMISNFMAGNIALANFQPSRREIKYLRDLLIAKFAYLKEPDKNKIKNLYKHLNFYNYDLQQINSRIWWKKTQALDRLGEMEMVEAEDKVFPLLFCRKKEVRFSALKMLTLIQSPKLLLNIPKLFEDSDRWSFRYLLNRLYALNIPPIYLKPLVLSPNRDFRKAAVILLGQKGNLEAIQFLKILVTDEIKDVRREAVRALGAIASTEALPLFSKTINDEDPQIRAATAAALSHISDKKSLNLLERLAQDADFEVRIQAFWSLKQSGPVGQNIIKNSKDICPELAEKFIKK